MSDESPWLKRLGAIIVVLVGIAALITFFLGFNDARRESAVLATELDGVRRELAAEKERNRRAFELLQWGASEGKIPYPKLVEHLSDDDAAAIVKRAGLQIAVSLPFDLEGQFFPSGWMGDGEFGEKYLSLSRTPSDDGPDGSVVIVIRYRAGPKGWAGIYWQYPGGNWGDQPGKSLVGAQAITFRAKGERGREIVEFKSGGIHGRIHSDSFERSLGAVTLAQSWNSYRIDLSGADLSSTIGAFAWSASASDNAGELTFYVTDLRVQ